MTHHLPCPRKECGSSDAYSSYPDGSGYCFSCKKYFPAGDTSGTEPNFEYKIVEWRGIQPEIMRKYRVFGKLLNNNLIALGFPYSKKGSLVKPVNGRHPYSEGMMKGPQLFGHDVFPAGGPEIIITEGAHDAMSAHQMTGIPAVAFVSASTANRDAKGFYEYINSFKKIILCLDNDRSGHEAVEQVAPLFDFHKVYNVTLTKHKDANEYLRYKNNEDISLFRQEIKQAKKFLPEGVISSYADVESVIKEGGRVAACSYPWQELEEKLEGMAFGEVVLLTGMEGIGKTEVCRALEHHILKETEYNVGVIHLEESKSVTIHGLVGYELEVPLKRRGGDIGVSHEDKMQAYRKLTKKDGRLHILSLFEGDSDNPYRVLDVIRFLVTVCECRFIILDHVTMLIGGVEEDRERQILKVITTRLAKMAEMLNFCLIEVSHVNDDGKTLSTRNTSKVAYVHVDLQRNPEHDNPAERNKIYTTVRKNRPTQATGPCGFIWYNETKGVLEDVETA